MMQEGKTIDDVRAFWNSRAGLGQWAGSRDVMLKQLEMMAISSYLKDGMRILEVGCGNGITAIEAAKRFNVDITGIDYAEEMITAARGLAEGQSYKGKLRFAVGDLNSMEDIAGGFDLIYTERVLINLESWDAQRNAIARITRLLKKGGLYVMCEHSQDGLDRINELRAASGLAKIDPPWHNRYFRDGELETFSEPGVQLEGINYFSSTYYFISRVVNAWLSAREGKEPDYDAPINQLAMSLPSIAQFGQGRIWLWRRVA
jgi:ubiquinone/menaquinone biosynthesis C-methylase UbiE